METGRYENARVEQAQRLCQRCDANSGDDVEHMIFDCVAMDAERQKHQSLFARVWTSCFGKLFHPEPSRIGCFCARLLQGLQRVISDSVLFIHGCLVRRPVVGYPNRPEMASNILLCNTSIIIY